MKGRTARRKAMERYYRRTGKTRPYDFVPWSVRQWFWKDQARKTERWLKRIVTQEYIEKSNRELLARVREEKRAEDLGN